MSLQIVLNTLKNLYLNQYLSNFSSKKKTVKGKYQTPQKTSIISHHLKSGVPPWDWSVLSADQHVVIKKYLVFNQHLLRKGNVIEKGGFR